MELEENFSLAIPLIFTALAVILATIWVKLRSSGGKQPAEASQQEETLTEPVEEEEKRDKQDQVAGEDVAERAETRTFPVEEVGTTEELQETKESEEEVAEIEEKERTPSSQSSHEEDSKEEDVEPEDEKVLKICEAEDADDEDISFRYLPGKLRGSDYEKMLTKDELEEEQSAEDKKFSLQSS